MAKYIGAVCRICRRQGEKLFLKGERCMTPKCAIERRNSPPGGRGLRRRKLSERGLQLREKQKARYIYGVLERQFQKHFSEAERKLGITGENLVQILERRLDNVIYRLGFADSRRQARQFVRHGHITLNGRKTDIPSALVKAGDTIGWVERSRRLENYKLAVEQVKSKAIPRWLSLDQENMVGKVVALPTRADIDARINEQEIVAYYSR